MSESLPEEAQAVADDCKHHGSVLRHLLVLADNYRDQGSRRQAMDVYWSLVDIYPSSPEGEQALQRLLQMAERFDREGMHRIARDLYEQLLDAGCNDHARA